MTDLYDKDGNLVEGFLSPEEVEQRLQEVKSLTIEETNATRQEEIDNLNVNLDQTKSDLEKAQKELEDEKGKDKNLSGQRRIIEAKEKQIEELGKKVGEVESKLTQKITDMETKAKEGAIGNMVKSLAGGNKELADKIKFYFDNFKGEAKDDKELQDRLQNAYTLATGGSRPINPLGSRVISNIGEVPGIGTGEKLNSDLVDLAHKMGIPDKDLKKHKLI